MSLRCIVILLYKNLFRVSTARQTHGPTGEAIIIYPPGVVKAFPFPVSQGDGGLYGLCQVIRTLAVERLGMNSPIDLAGVL